MMDPVTAAVLTSVATGYFVNFTTPTVKRLFEKAFAFDPSLEEELKQAETPQDFEEVLNRVVGTIDASAGTGNVKVNGALMEAMRGIRFDHQDGTVTIDGATLQAPRLYTGGKGKGKTSIGSDSALHSEGTSIQIGQGAFIEISGDASITQN